MIFPFPTEWKVMKNSMVPVTTNQNPLIWVCLKMLCTPFLPNGFADHYPVFKWLFHWEYTQHFQTNPYVPFPRSVFVAWIFSRDLGPAIDLAAAPKKRGLPKKREVQQLGGSPMKNGDEWLLNWKNTEFEPTKIEIDYPKPLFNHEK